MKPKFKAIIFDFDNTLADSAAAIAECAAFALGRLGLTGVPLHKLNLTHGLPLPEMFLHLAGPQHIARRDEFVRLYREHADKVMMPMTTLFESVPKTLPLLKKSGLSLGIVSTKGRLRIQPILEREGLLALFDVIIGGEDVTEYKPAPQGLLAAVGRLASSPAECLYVGDSPVDAEAAMRAGVPFVAVLSGMLRERPSRNIPGMRRSTVSRNCRR
jgi:phosphoglycolate phosphatase